MRDICCCQAAVSQHPLPFLRTGPKASYWCERKQSKPSSSTAPAGSTWLPLSCAREMQLLLSSCWHSECRRVLLPQRVKIGLNSHWNGWHDMPPCSASICSWIMLTGNCYTGLIQGVNLSSRWCILDKNTWESHLSETTIWSRMSYPYQITSECHLQKLGQSASHQPQRSMAEMLFQLMFWDATSSGERALSNFCGDSIFCWQVPQKHFNAIQFCLEIFSWSTN